MTGPDAAGLLPLTVSVGLIALAIAVALLVSAVRSRRRRADALTELDGIPVVFRPDLTAGFDGTGGPDNG